MRTDVEKDSLKNSVEQVDEALTTLEGVAPGRARARHFRLVHRTGGKSSVVSLRRLNRLVKVMLVMARTTSTICASVWPARRTPSSASTGTRPRVSTSVRASADRASSLVSPDA